MPPKKNSKNVDSSAVVDSVVVPEVSVPVVPVETVVETVVEPQDVSSQTVDQYSVVIDKLASFVADAKALQAIVKTLQKEHSKLQIKGGKKNKNKDKQGGTRAPSGFAKPAIVSDDMCEFIGVEKGTQMARTVVTKVINEYIKKNELQDPSDKRRIILDDKLSKIITLSPDDRLTYFNLQSYIKQHFNQHLNKPDEVSE